MGMMEEEEADYQKQFDAAVRVIQGLPKNGAYRPSYEEMLRFYSYYKQATVGRCQIPRPGFWDPIGRYKWDAWNSLGKMTKMEAMAAYIAEMKKAAQKVINTVPLDESSEDMFVYFEPLYEVIHDMPRPPDSFFKKKAVKTGSESAPLHNGSLRGLAENIPPEHGECNQTGPADKEIKSSHVPSDSESEVFCDSLEHVEPDQVRRLSAMQNLPLNNIQSGEKTGYKTSASSTREGKPNKVPQTVPTGERGLGSSAGAVIQRDVDLQVMSAIQALQEDMKKVMERLGYLESRATFQGHTSMLNPCRPTSLHNGKEPPGWPAQLSPRTWFFLLAWPFIIQWLHWYFQRQKR
ncbi:acyl-CoA-binding domain-containing protein 4 isoform X2 [Zootoca vivipara]|uniref:acyl-CoA-binding domain-containing protein 4 isoform X2 n=1 Tax=Zootoca vivipara TaxID=8524 RepID=UPI00293BB488|nr:acyl-CoA-binding domain-containing protein 4 isoform X2 [Zootoca vivipara]